MTPVEKRNAAGDRYAAAVKEMWDAWADLAALDQITVSASFGTPPETIYMRHPIYLPGLSGSIVDGVRPAIERHRRDGM